MRRNGKQVCIIGLGHFGAGLAKALARHCEVLAIDTDIHKVDEIADHVHSALCLDGRDESALSSVVTPDFDEAMVCIGEEIEASILCALHLKHIGVPVIRAKAVNADHAEILRAVGVTQVVFPELETARRLALQVMNPNLLDFVPLSQDYQVIDVAAPEGFLGRTFSELEIRKRMGLLVIAVKRDDGETFEFLPGPDHVVDHEDVFVVIGREADILRLQDGDLPALPPRPEPVCPDPSVHEPPTPAPSASPPAKAAAKSGRTKGKKAAKSGRAKGKSGKAKAKGKSGKAKTGGKKK